MQPIPQSTCRISERSFFIGEGPNDRPALILRGLPDCGLAYSEAWPTVDDDETLRRVSAYHDWRHPDGQPISDEPPSRRVIIALDDDFLRSKLRPWLKRLGCREIYEYLVNCGGNRPGFVVKAPHLDRIHWNKIREHVLIHHSWDFIEKKLLPELSDIELMPGEDYPMANAAVSGSGTELTVVATRMGIDNTLNIVDQLTELGAKTIIKIGSFVALRENIDIGELGIPDNAVRLPGPIDAILPRDVGTQLISASGELVKLICSIVDELWPIDDDNVQTWRGTVLSNPLYGPYIRDEVIDPIYSIDRWRGICFGAEMECAALFAVGEAKKVRTAAILVCNRRWEVLDNYRRGHGGDWYQHRSGDQYHDGCRNAVQLALRTMYTIEAQRRAM